MKEALELALEALEQYLPYQRNEKERIAFAAIKAALSQHKPSTDEKISLIAHNIDTGDWNDLNFKECWHEGFKVGFREAEIEYSIKGVKHE